MAFSFAIEVTSLPKILGGKDAEATSVFVHKL
jgi:hypothetical protein